MNKKIAISGVSILTALALMAGATFALFTDQASSQDNTFTTGNADLQIATDTDGTPGTFANDITGPTVSGVLPGESEDMFFWLKNNSSADLDLNLTTFLDGIGGADAALLQGVMTVQFTCDTDGDGLGTGDTSTSTKTIIGWDSSLNEESIGSLVSGTQMRCQMTTTLPSGADSTLAGKTISFDGRFDGEQIP